MEGVERLVRIFWSTDPNNPSIEPTQPRLILDATLGPNPWPDTPTPLPPGHQHLAALQRRLSRLASAKHTGKAAPS